MLGKTNITALSEGGIVTEIEDYRWIQMQTGIYGNFVKAIYKGGYLVAITADGTVAYTADGEVWNMATLEYKNCRLNDIDWDGSNFVLAGSYLNEDNNTSQKTRLMLATADFENFRRIGLKDQGECYAVMPQNGRYIVVASDERDVVFAVFTGLDATTVDSKRLTSPTSSWLVHHCITAKNTAEMLAYIHINYAYSGSNSHCIYKICDGLADMVIPSENKLPDVKAMVPFECKGSVYFMDLLQERNYNLNKVTDSDEILTMCTGQNFMFVDGVYFDECQVFINNHEMLIVRKGESIADKTLDDLIEIAPEFTMNCITKAFGQLYIFGNQGVILKSSVETDNNEAIIVQTLSAKKALADAKAYTDVIYAELEARIAAMEMMIDANS